jgi:lipoteichoic acid synthase
MKNTLKERLKKPVRNIAVSFLILMYWELFLYYQLHSSFEGFTYWNALFMIPLSFLLAGLTDWSSKHLKSDGIFKSLILLAVGFFYVGDFIYYKTFGSLASVSMMGMGTDAINSFWWSLKTTVSENMGLILFFELPGLIELILTLTGKKKESAYGIKGHLAMLGMVFVSWFVIVSALPLAGTADHTAYGAYYSRYVDTDTASRKLGVLPNFVVELRYSLFGSSKNGSVLQANEEAAVEEVKETIVVDAIQYNKFEDLNFDVLAAQSDDDTIKALCEYLDGVTPTRQNDYTGLFEGKSLIYICAESFSSLAIDEDVTPTLYKLANNGIVLNNYYNSFRNTTTNGEYAFLTGVWPDVARKETNMGKITGTMGQSMDKDMSMALGNMFNVFEDIESRGYHNYLGNYYGRNRTLPNMGFTCKFMNDGMKFTTAWPASDLEMMEQSVDDYINDKQFCTYYMTFSGHGNYTTNNIMVYRNIRTVDSLVEEYLPESAIGYLAANYELEKAMTYLVERLEEAGRLDDTVIVLTGDHYPYYLTDYGYKALSGEEMDEDFDSFKSTCIIYNSGLRKKIEVDTPCCNVDILPTILNLFGIQYDSRLYAGTDIFGSGAHIAQIYNRNFITDKVRYNYATGKAEWLIDTEKYDQDRLDSYLESMINIVKNRYAMSIEIEESDFYSFVFDHFDLESVKEKSIEEVTVETPPQSEVIDSTMNRN